MSDRITREREYHNKAFSEGLRKPAEKFYSIHKSSLDQLYALLAKYGKGKDVLEYGCGTGGHIVFLTQHAQTVTAIDISDYAIQTAREKVAELNIDNASFFEMNAEHLNFEDDSFDLVFGNSIIHHLDLKQAYSEIKRVLRPGGVAIFYEPLGHNYFINKYRSSTSQMRTADEHPLLMKDIKLAGSYFHEVTVEYYHLTTLAAVPFRNTFLFNSWLGGLSLLDKTLFSLFPFIKKYAWFSIIVLKNE
ncbi:MAG: class I SAM-dependent methyltransferase [Bacteroidales bacterium]